MAVPSSLVASICVQFDPRRYPIRIKSASASSESASLRLVFVRVLCYCTTLGSHSTHSTTANGALLISSSTEVDDRFAFQVVHPKWHCWLPTYISTYLTFQHYQIPSFIFSICHTSFLRHKSSDFFYYRFLSVQLDAMYFSILRAIIMRH